MTPKPATRAISTFTRSTGVCLAVLAVVALIVPRPAGASSEYLEKATRALESRDRRAADFWFARHLATSVSGAPQEAELEYLRARRLDPRVFPTPNADPGYLEWLERSSWRQWAPEDPKKIRARQQSVEIASSAAGEHQASVVAYPEIQRWFATDGPEVLRQLILAAGRTDRKAVLFVARSFGGSLVYLRPAPLYSQTALLVHAWPPAFEDADGDGEPEVWVRYNLLWNDGPAQALSVFKIDDAQPEIFHQFFAGTGGMVRRLPDGSVEMGVREGPGRFRVETWRCADGTFQKKDDSAAGSADWLSESWRDYL